jgi:undecaprenyl-phosphate 4-deoxy-4-formamido-L-arabinose transferase
MDENEIIITIDDDLQNPPEEIPKLVKLINEGKDLVYVNFLQKSIISLDHLEAKL